jgi:hypothetical protein
MKYLMAQNIKRDDPKFNSEMALINTDIHREMDMNLVFGECICGNFAISDRLAYFVP